MVFHKNKTFLWKEIVTNCYAHNDGNPIYTWEVVREFYFNGDLIYSDEYSGRGWIGGFPGTSGSHFGPGLHRCESEMSDNPGYYEEFKNTPADRFIIREPGLENNTEEEEGFCPDMPEGNGLLNLFLLNLSS